MCHWMYALHTYNAIHIFRDNDNMIIRFIVGAVVQAKICSVALASKLDMDNEREREKRKHFHLMKWRPTMCVLLCKCIECNFDW